MAAGVVTAYLVGDTSFVTNLTNFLDVLLVVLTPWSAVNLADYFLVRRGPLRRRLVLHRRRGSPDSGRTSAAHPFPPGPAL